MSFTDIAQAFFNGIAIGSVIALAAVGLTLTYGILKLSNFAHGDYMTLGAYLTWFCNINGLNIPIAMFCGALGTVVAMLVAEFLLWQPMRKQRATPTTLIILSIGLALFVRNSILFVWGGSNQFYDIPPAPATDVLGVKIAFYRLVAIALAVVAAIVLHFILQNSKIGKAMRAVADNIDLARVSGINVDRVILWTWVITGVLVALAGTTYGLITVIRPNMGWFLILPMFASVILGGIGNPYGAIAGALIIGVAQELSALFLDPAYKQGIALAIMVVILLVRPRGLFKGTM
ncbi:MAG: branched-chain amino acid ABC transporter permease [Prochloraceae cyanobacterium]